MFFFIGCLNGDPSFHIDLFHFSEDSVFVPEVVSVLFSDS